MLGEHLSPCEHAYPQNLSLHPKKQAPATPAIIMVQFILKAIIPPVLVLFDFNMNEEKFMW